MLGTRDPARKCNHRGLCEKDLWAAPGMSSECAAHLGLASPPKGVLGHEDLVTEFEWTAQSKRETEGH